MRHVLVCLPLLVLLPCTAWTAVPTTMLLEGQLVAASGQNVPDGKYAVTFRMYDAPSAGNVLWQEGPEDVVVAGGLFSQAIGQKTALTGDKLAASGAWLSLQVATDTELPRQPLASVPYALRAQVAEGLACTGCVTAAMLDGGVLTPYATVQSLSQYALQTALASYVTGAQLTTELATYAEKSALSNVAFSGQYADLLGLPTVAGLPPNGLSTISNDLLTNVFTTLTGHAALELPIKDCYGLGVTDTVTIPDLGIAQDLSVDVSITNSNLAGLTVLLIDPTGQ